MQDHERMKAHEDHAYSQVIAGYTAEHGSELDSDTQDRLRDIHTRAAAQSRTASDYHRFGMDSEVLLAGETKGRIEALRDLGFISLEGAELARTR